jgi:3-dehydroquinate synthase
MQELNIRVPGTTATSYRIVIGSELLPSLWPTLDVDFPKLSRFIVTDANVAAAGHLDRLRQGRDVPTHVIEPTGEPSKTIGTAVAIVEAMERACLGRDTLVLGLGGGTVGDIAGFAAAIFKRGVPIVQIPTTTLAQADSALGGKTGVDSSISKNAFGAFWHPAAVFLDTATLQTLDERQYRAGLVESIKHGLIADREYFEFIETHLEAILNRDAASLATLARCNCTIKGRIVEQDPREKNKRRILNYGHTIGHAVEAAGDYALLHGEAVAVGIIAAGFIELELGLGELGRLDRTRTVLEKLGVPIKLPQNLADDKVLDVMRHDKKAVDQWPRFVLLDRLGQVHQKDGQYAVPVARAVIENVLKKLR